MISIMKKHPLLKIANGALVDLPCPSNISYFWNFGSLLGLSLMIQILTGLFLAMNFSASTSISFESVVHISQSVDMGWLVRIFHANGASMFFLFLYLHTGRGMYYGSYLMHMTWSVGVIIFLAVMAAAFLGYVLPWGQMSFWGATVITSLFSALPYIGEDVVIWLWGGFAVDNATLTRFFSLHFLLPILVAGMVMVHFLFLHETGSSNPLGVCSNSMKIPFHPYFSLKDLLGVTFSLLFLSYVCFFYPWLLGDPENFIPGNPLVTPVHIQPEWYFLFAYAILRSIPNKLGGVVALALAVLILLIMPFQPKTKFRNLSHYWFTKSYYWYWVSSVFLLTWIGARPVEEPYILAGQILTLFYFSYYMLVSFTMKIWDMMLD